MKGAIMEYVYSIMMFCMAGGLLLYAGLLALAKDPMLIPRHYAARMKDGEAYAVMIAKVVALVAVPFAISGTVGLIWTSDQTLVPAIIAFIASLVACIWLCRKIVRKSY